MNAGSKQLDDRTVNLQLYADEILSDEDRPLFDEAVKAANVGALRAAYIMVWLACAESLKRRFKGAAIRDSAAGSVVAEINRREQNQSSVDKTLITQAKTYGFISDSGHTDLVNVYDNRCIYGHPYHEAPSIEKLLAAADAVVRLVLSQPILLKQGFGTQLLNDLMTNRPYLDDQASVVEDFARNMAPRFHEDVLVWFFDQCLERIDTMYGDASMGLFFRRGVWFARTFLQEVGVAILTADEWHEKSTQYPYAFVEVCSAPTVFERLGDYAQDALVGLVIDQSKQQASALRLLENLRGENSLSDRQLAPDEQDPSGQMWGSALTASKEWVRTETYNLWKVNPDKAAAHQQSHTIPVDTKGNPDSTYEDRRPQDLTHTHDPDDPNYVATHPNTWDIDIKLKSYSHNHGLILYGSHDLRFPCYKGGEDRTQPPPHTCHMRVGYDEQELIARGVSDPAERQRLLTKIKEHCCDQHSVTVPDTAGVRRQRQTDLGIIQAHNRQVRAAWNLLKHYDEAAYTQAMNAWFIANQARKDAYTAEIRAQDDRMQARHDSGLMYVYCPNSGCVIINKYR